MKTVFVILLIIFSVWLTGCTTLTDHLVQKIEVPIPIKCKIVPPQKPSTPLQEADVSESKYDKTKKALAEIEYRKGYELQLEAAIQECNK